MIFLNRGALADFYKVAGNHSISFILKIPDSHMLVGIRSTAYGGKWVEGSKAYIAIVNPEAPDHYARVLTKIEDLHSWVEVKVMHDALSSVSTQYTELTVPAWCERLSEATGVTVEVVHAP